MKSKTLLLMALLAGHAADKADACLPLSEDRYANTPERVLKQFSNSDTVIIATLLKAEYVKVKSGGIDFEMDAEKTTFRIDRVFKGKLKPGQTFAITSFSSCARKVGSKARINTYMDDIDGKPMNLLGPWLLYMDDGEQIEITDSPRTRPLELAKYDVSILESVAQKAKTPEK